MAIPLPLQVICDEPTRDVEHLERDLCTNYLCCNLRIPDLHELVDHFEVYHLDNRLYCGPSSPATSEFSFSSSSDSSLCSEVPITPTSVLSQAYPSHETPTDLLNAIHPTLLYPSVKKIPAHGFVDVAESRRCPSASPSLSPASSPPLASPGGPMRSQKQIRNVRIAAASQRGSHTSVASEETVTPIPAPVLPSSDPLPDPVKGETGTRKDKRGNRRRGTARVTSGVKDKTYSCPKPGCIKVYRNPGGLKYHVERGTCEFSVLASSPAGEPELSDVSTFYPSLDI